MAKKARKPRKTLAQQYAETPLEEIIKTYKETRTEDGQTAALKYMQRVVSNLRQGYKKAIKKIEETGEFSFAQFAYKREGGRVETITQLKKKTEQAAKANSQLDKGLNLYNRYLMEIAKYQSFFHAETSTPEGVERVNRQQDVDLFGGTKEKPNYRMSRDEREAYWDFYENFFGSSEKSTSFQSGETQTALADAVRGKLSEKEIAAMREKFSGFNGTLDIDVVDDEEDPNKVDKLRALNALIEYRSIHGTTRGRGGRTVDFKSGSDFNVHRGQGNY